LPFNDDDAGEDNPICRAPYRSHLRGAWGMADRFSYNVGIKMYDSTGDDEA